MKQGFDVFHDDFGLVRAVMGLRAANGGRGTCVDSKLKPQDGVPGTVLIETIPPILDHGADGVGISWVDGVPDAEALGKLRQIPGGLKKPKVSTCDGKDRGRAAKGSAVLGEQKKVVVEFVRHGHRNVTSLRLGPPNLWRDVNHQHGIYAASSRGSRQRHR
jgi:hypothetical protein